MECEFVNSEFEKAYYEFVRESNSIQSQTEREQHPITNRERGRKGAERGVWLSLLLDSRTNLKFDYSGYFRLLQFWKNEERGRAIGEGYLYLKLRTPYGAFLVEFWLHECRCRCRCRRRLKIDGIRIFHGFFAIY